MQRKNIFTEYDNIPYSTYAAIGAFDDLPPKAVTDHANAVSRIDKTPDERILAVAPSSMASGYALAQQPLTAIDLTALPTPVFDALAGATDRELSGYTLLILGRAPQHDNHTLEEYA